MWRTRVKFSGRSDKENKGNDNFGFRALGFAFSLVALVAISIVTSIFQVSKTMTF